MTSSPTPDYCFKRAYDRLASKCYDDHFGFPVIESDEFWRHIFRHFQGVRHPEDKQRPSSRIDNASRTEPRASTVNAIRDIALWEEYEPLDDTAVDGLVRLFMAVESDDDASMKAEFNVLTSDLKVPERLLVQPLAVLAVQVNCMNSAKWVRFFFTKGAKLDDAMADALKWYEGRAATVGMLDWLYERNWKKIRTSKVWVKTPN
jgi:hypothetical protein